MEKRDNNPPRGKIPEFQMKAYRYSDRQRGAVIPSASAPVLPEPAAPAQPPAPAVPVALTRSAAETVAALAKTMQSVQPVQAAKIPVKDVPSSQVIDEVVRRSLGRL